MNDYWELTNISYRSWRKIVFQCQIWPRDPIFQAMACRAQADYVMYSAFEQWEINHGNRKV